MLKQISTPQEILYIIAVKSWESAKNDLAAFQAFDASYTNQTIDDAFNAITAAEAIMNESQRDAAAKAAHELYVGKAKAAFVHWQRLKVYIEKSFPEAIVPAMIEAAGGRSYTAAAHGNYPAAKKLFDDSVYFLNQKSTELLAGGMPTTFTAEFTTLVTAAKNSYTNFNNLELVKDQLTIEKNEADYEVYTTMMKMMKDGKVIFRDEPSKRQLYTLSHLEKVVRGSQPAKLRGKITDINGKPITNARIYAEDAPFDLHTNKKGRYLINRIAAGTYYFIIDRPGYLAQEIEITIRPGIYNTMNATLEASQQLQKVA